MKKLLILILSLAALSSQAQKKKKQQEPDSVSYRNTSDTIFGVISYVEGNGVITGDGCVVSEVTYELHWYRTEAGNHGTWGGMGTEKDSSILAFIRIEGRWIHVWQPFTLKIK